MSRTRKAAKFGVLPDAECRAILARNHVGRIGFMRKSIVDVTPVHFVGEHDWIFVRSAAGAKLEAFAHRPYVAFEVDEVDDLFNWRSVVAHGTVYAMSDTGNDTDRADFERALVALRSLVPGTLTASDPTPHRDVVYGIHIDRLSGRAATRG